MSAKPYVRIFRTSPVWQEHKSPDFSVKPCLPKTQKSGFFGVRILSKPLYMISKKQITNLVVVPYTHVFRLKQLELLQLGSLHSNHDLRFDSNNHIRRKKSIFHLPDCMNANNHCQILPTVQNKALKINC